MFDIETIPGLSAEDLASARETILALAADVTDETPIEDIDALSLALDAVDAETASRAALAAERSAKMSRFAVAPVAPAPEAPAAAAAPAKSFAFVKNAPTVDTTPAATEPQGIETAGGLVASIEDMGTAWARHAQASKGQTGKNIFMTLPISGGVDGDTADFNSNALTAAACGPAEVIFGFECPAPGQGTPIADLFPTVTTSRAQVTLQTESFDMADFLPGFSTGSVCDLTANKTCVELACGASRTLCLDWVSNCITVPRAMSRFAPETLQRNLAYNAAAFDRLIDSQAYAAIVAAAGAPLVAPVTSGYSVTDTVFAVLQRFVSGQYNRLRGNVGAWSAVAPAWLRDAIKVDIARERDQPLGAISDAEVNSYLASTGISKWAWSYDLQPLPAGIAPYPATVDIALFEGGARFSGGTLSIGEFIDSALVQANKVSIFNEVFQVWDIPCAAAILTIPVCTSHAEAPRSATVICP